MTIAKVECWVLRAPIDVPVRASLGVLKDRPAVFVRVSADDGAWGWGEVFCNFPQPGAEHRARLLREIVGPLAEGQPSDQPETVWRALTARLRRLAIQCGEPGPFAQAVSAIDQALWDLAARRAGVPLWRLLAASPAANGSVRPYASGLGPDRVAETALRKRDEGYAAFKFKVGFGVERDVENFREIRAALGSEATVMIDANQAWEPADAPRRIDELARFEPAWVEEPIAADETLRDWKILADSCGLPLAAGENIRGEADFSAAIANGHLRYVQPDVAKWGGISACLAVARQAEQAGLICCPHWLGAGVGLAASAHLRAALGPRGYLEVDANPNPLREQVFELTPRDGLAWLADTAGIGVEPDLRRLKAFLV